VGQGGYLPSEFWSRSCTFAVLFSRLDFTISGSQVMRTTVWGWFELIQLFVSPWMRIRRSLLLVLPRGAPPQTPTSLDFFLPTFPLGTCSLTGNVGSCWRVVLCSHLPPFPSVPPYCKFSFFFLSFLTYSLSSGGAVSTLFGGGGALFVSDLSFLRHLTPIFPQVDARPVCTGFDFIFFAFGFPQARFFAWPVLNLSCCILEFPPVSPICLQLLLEGQPQISSPFVVRPLVPFSPPSVPLCSYH